MFCTLKSYTNFDHYFFLQPSSETLLLTKYATIITMQIRSSQTFLPGHFDTESLIRNDNN